MLGILLLTALGSIQSQPSLPVTIPISRALIIDSVGHYSRNIVHTDVIEAELAAGKSITPEKGEQITLPDGKARVWRSAAIDAKGEVSDKRLAGGYADLVVDSLQPQSAILTAEGDALVYVNGSPRPGDVYGYGYLQLPIKLKSGRNDLLFLCTGSTLHVQLIPARAIAQFDTGDITLPDIILGRPTKMLGALPVINTTGNVERGLKIRAQAGDGPVIITSLPDLPRRMTRKVMFKFQPPLILKTGNTPLHLKLYLSGKLLDTADLSLRVRAIGDTYKVTFISNIDGSVQYYAVNPAHPLVKNPPLSALTITLHGAGVEAIGQADAYEAKSWDTLVAPTNRRPYGFDWEDWGRMDAIEVLHQALKTLPVNPRRVFLAGHSMGGHGTWQVGVWFPDQFAAIGPSSAWVSFFSYVGTKPYPDSSPIGAVLNRADNVSDTLLMGHNYAQEGIYILHGSADDNVPVTEARNMVKYLSAFQHDFRYHEQPGAGHWWDISPEPGADCVDWAPMYDFFNRHYLPIPYTVRRIDFTTVNPGVSAQDDWVTIEEQEVSLALSHIHIRVDPGLRRFVGTTQNVEFLKLDLHCLPPDKPFSVILDGQTVAHIPWPDSYTVLLQKTAGIWAEKSDMNAGWKDAVRYGPFKEAFQRNMLFVYGSHGNAEEDEINYEKARYDQETFWYRGNGSVDVMPDREFQPGKYKNRDVILYGNADTNSAWKPLLGNSPVQIKDDFAQIGTHIYHGGNLACLFVRPRPDSPSAMVAVVSGTGGEGMRLTYRLPIFLSGVAWPDCTLMSARALSSGLKGVLAAGFFGLDWGVKDGDFAYSSH